MSVFYDWFTNCKIKAIKKQAKSLFYSNLWDFLLSFHYHLSKLKSVFFPKRK